MFGQRVYPTDHNEIVNWQPGDYGYVESAKCWYAQCPGGLTANLGNHLVIEHDDHTITVTPSILVTMHVDEVQKVVWHGYLEHGTWREC